MPRFRCFLYTLTLAFLLAGCGQSGPLYMPGNPSQVTVPASQAAEPADEDSEDPDDSD